MIFDFDFIVPPQNVVITPASPEVKADDEITLSCASGSSNPVSEISWSKNETAMWSGATQTGFYPSAYQGMETRSR